MRDSSAKLKRSSFQLGLCPISAHQRPRKVPVRKVGQLTSAVPKPPAALCDVATNLIMGIYAEIHSLAERGAHLPNGQFGHWTFCVPSDFELRIIQMGWSVGETSAGSASHGEEILVRPDGYAITEGATKKHGVTMLDALTHGISLRDALAKFMAAAKRVHEQGGRAANHHFEFDAGIIYAELQRAGLEEWRSLWRTIAQRGVCTMDRDIQKWMQSCFGQEMILGEKTLVLSLKDSLQLVHRDKNALQELLKKSHTAGADSQMHRILLDSLLGLAKVSCGANDQNGTDLVPLACLSG